MEFFGDQRYAEDRAGADDEERLPELRVRLLHRAEGDAERLAERGVLEGDVLRLLGEPVDRDEEVLGVRAVASEADLLEVFAVAPLAAQARGALAADHVVASDDRLADPVLVLRIADRVDDAAPLVAGDQRIVRGDLRVDDFQVRRADGGGFHFDAGKAGRRDGNIRLDQVHSARRFDSDCFHAFLFLSVNSFSTGWFC